MAENPDIILEIKDYSDQAHLGVEEGITDLAFTVVKFESATVQVRPVFAEPMVFLCRGQPVRRNSWKFREKRGESGKGSVGSGP